MVNQARSWFTFERRYKPISGADGVILRNWDDPDVQAAEERFIWTVVDCDGRCYLTLGFATVNYLGRVLCAVPWPREEFTDTGYLY